MPHDPIDLNDNTPHIFVIELPEDYKKSLELRKKVFVEEQKVPEDLEVDEFEKQATYFLAEIGKTAVATGRIRETSHGIKFERILTLKEYRGQGTGSLLMHFMQEYCRERFPQKALYMHSQVHALSFYEKLGWAKEGTSFFEAGIEHFKMSFV